MKTYVVIPVNGLPERLLISPMSGYSEYEALRKAVGWYIEGVRTQLPGAMMYVNEEGLILGLEINRAASMFAGQPIVGPAVLTGLVDANGDNVSLDDDLVMELCG